MERDMAVESTQRWNNETNDRDTPFSRSHVTQEHRRGLSDVTKLAELSDGMLLASQFGNLSFTGTEDGNDRLFLDYKRRPKKFFKFGRVFAVLWAEPSGEVGSDISSNITFGDNSQRVFSKIRRFVVIRAGPDSASCIPILTYGNRGVSKLGVQKSDHGIVYTTTVPPAPSASERPREGELGMRPHSIHVCPDNPTRKLHPMSRINYGKIYTVEHNVRVRPFGAVSPSDLGLLLREFHEVWDLQPMGLDHMIQHQHRSSTLSRFDPEKPSIEERMRTNRADVGNSAQVTNHMEEEAQGRGRDTILGQEGPKSEDYDSEIV